VSAWLLNGVN